MAEAINRVQYKPNGATIFLLWFGGVEMQQSRKDLSRRKVLGKQRRETLSSHMTVCDS